MGWGNHEDVPLKSICEMLVEIGCIEVHVEYDGEGDDGCITHLLFIDKEGEEFKGVVLNKSIIEDSIKDYCYEVLSAMPHDWINNNGGFGVISLDTKEQRWSNDFSQRVNTTEEYNFSGEI